MASYFFSSYIPPKLLINLKMLRVDLNLPYVVLIILRFSSGDATLEALCISLYSWCNYLIVALKLSCLGRGKGTISFLDLLDERYFNFMSLILRYEVRMRSTFLSRSYFSGDK
jgi:hypothetical protein